MNEQQRTALVAFGLAVADLKAAGVIRSHKYLGDIAEFIGSTLKLELAADIRQHGHDGEFDGKRVQVKYGGSTKTNISLGHPDFYDEVWVVLGPESVMREKGDTEDFLVYKLTAAEVKTFNRCRDGTYSCGKYGWKGKAAARISMANPDAAAAVAALASEPKQ